MSVPSPSGLAALVCAADTAPGIVTPPRDSGGCGVNATEAADPEHDTPVGFQNSATVRDQRFHAAGSYWLISHVHVSISVIAASRRSRASARRHHSTASNALSTPAPPIASTALYLLALT